MRIGDLRVPTDQHVHLALLGLVVEIDAIGGQRLATLRRPLLLARLLVGPAHPLRLGKTSALGDAMADVVHGIEP